MWTIELPLFDENDKLIHNLAIDLNKIDYDALAEHLGKINDDIHLDNYMLIQYDPQTTNKLNEIEIIAYNNIEIIKKMRIDYKKFYIHILENKDDNLEIFEEIYLNKKGKDIAITTYNRNGGYSSTFITSIAVEYVQCMIFIFKLMISKL